MLQWGSWSLRRGLYQKVEQSAGKCFTVVICPQGSFQAGGGSPAAEGEHPRRTHTRLEIMLAVIRAQLSLGRSSAVLSFTGSRANHGSHGPGINRTATTPTPDNATETAAPSPASSRKLLRAMAEHDALTSSLPIHYQVRAPSCAFGQCPRMLPYRLMADLTTLERLQS